MLSSAANPGSRVLARALSLAIFAVLISGVAAFGTNSVNLEQSGTHHGQTEGRIVFSSGVVLSSVGISPSSANVTVGGTANFTAIPSCTGGPCPMTGISYAWSVNSSLGKVGSSTGNTTVLRAGAESGDIAVFVNATLNQTTVSAPPSLVTITSSSPPTVSSVSIVPSTFTMEAGNTTVFTAVPSCTQGTCPGGISYIWSLANDLGSLNSSSTDTVSFIAGNETGNETLMVNATLNGETKEGSAKITITPFIPTIASVSVSPDASTVTVKKSQAFSATATCSGGECPLGISFTWSLTGSLGSLNTTSGPSVLFTAGAKPGAVTLYVVATLNGRTVQSTLVPIVIASAPTTQSTGFLGLPGDLGYVAVGGAVAAAVAVVVAGYVQMKGRKPEVPKETKKPSKDRSKEVKEEDEGAEPESDDLH